MVPPDRRSLDSVLYVLGDRRRRHVLAYLRDAEGGTATVDELTDHVVEQETNSPFPDREQVSISLYHNHLPKLAETGVVKFDTHAEEVRYVDRPEVESVLDSVVRRDADAERHEE